METINFYTGDFPEEYREEGAYCLRDDGSLEIMFRGMLFSVERCYNVMSRKSDGVMASSDSIVIFREDYDEDTGTYDRVFVEWMYGSTELQIETYTAQRNGIVKERGTSMLWYVYDTVRQLYTEVDN